MHDVMLTIHHKDYYVLGFQEFSQPGFDPIHDDYFEFMFPKFAQDFLID